MPRVRQPKQLDKNIFEMWQMIVNVRVCQRGEVTQWYILEMLHALELVDQRLFLVDALFSIVDEYASYILFLVSESLYDRLLDIRTHHWITMAIDIVVNKCNIFRARCILDCSLIYESIPLVEAVVCHAASTYAAWF